jgi:hypothetical protein
MARLGRIGWAALANTLLGGLINISIRNTYLMLKLISDFHAWGRERASEEI